MRLTLSLQSYCGQNPDRPQEKSYENFPVYIGRSSSCDFVLDDVSRYISSNHATVLIEKEQLLIQDTSANGVYLNGSTESIGRGNIAPLSSGDSLAIGDYSLKAVVSTAAAINRAADPFDDFGTADDQAPVQDAFDPFRGEEHDWTPESEKKTDAGFPEHDLWDEAKPAVEPVKTDDSAWSDWPVEDAPSGPSPSDPAPASDTLDNDLDWLPGTSSETISTPRPIQNPGAVPIAAEAPTSANNPPHGHQRFDDPPAYRAPANRMPADRTPVHQAPVPQAPAHRTPAYQAPQPASHHDADAAIKTLLLNAGLNPANFAHEDSEQLLQTAGQLLKESLDGIIVLLHSRNELKNAIRTDLTQLARENNNPLKFTATAEDAMAKMLTSNSQRGYLPADMAIGQAVDDLKAHQLAMLDGMKAAVRSMLRKFDPEKLEKILEKENPIAANIPITREAKLWQLFQDKFGDIRDEAFKDFNELFGREFRKAYEKRIAELGRKPDF